MVASRGELGYVRFSPCPLPVSVAAPHPFQIFLEYSGRGKNGQDNKSWTYSRHGPSSQNWIAQISGLQHILFLDQLVSPPPTQMLQA